MDKKNPESKANIRNSTSEFLIFTQQEGEKGIEARYEEGTIWLTQKLMADLFAVDTNTVGEHLQNIFKSYELDQNSVTRKFRVTASDGKNYNTQFYNLDAIISKDHAECEFEKYRIIQDRLFESDFDKEMKAITEQMKNNGGS